MTQSSLKMLGKQISCVVNPSSPRRLLNPSARFELTFSTPDTFQVQILSEIDDKTTVY